MEDKFHGLPPLKRCRLMQQAREQEHENDSVAASLHLPAKKRKESRDLPPPIPNPASAAFCLPAKKRVWALQPNLVPDNPISPFDLNVEYKPTFDEEDPQESVDDPSANSNQIAEDEGENEEDDDGIQCAVCQSTDGDPSDPIVFCDGCDLMAHTTCYGSPLTKGVPEGDWFCTQCLASQSPQTGNAKAFSCCLCPANGGAMKPTNDGRWAHVVCALLVPEVFFADPEAREGIDCSKVPHGRWDRSCYVCNTANTGCVIDCSELKCPLAFHVTCGLKEDLCIEYSEGRNKVAIVAGFCKNHTELWKKQQQTGKFKIVARDEHKKFFVLAEEMYTSAIGDPGMRRDGLRVAIEAWNQCNEVGEEAPNMGSPRAADCFDVDNATSPIKLVHKVNVEDNRLGISDAPFKGLDVINVNQYAAWKEIYLGNKCQVEDQPRPWQFWMIMLKSGNMDTLSAICPKNGKKSKPFPPQPGFPCFGEGCMNVPLIFHNYTKLEGDQESSTLRGSFYGTWDLDAEVTKAATENDTSYYSVTWEKEVGKGSWLFHHVLKTSSKYPWLMLYFRSDATSGVSGGYHYSTRGMSKIVPKSPNLKVRFALDVKQGGGLKSQFYLMDIGSCWKNNGQPCDGDVTTDVTRYSEMILNPNVDSWCNLNSLGSCPPYHTLPNGTRIHRTDKENYPYEAYHIYCSPGNAQHLEEPYNLCDPYSNPQPQEILQIRPHPAWGEYGYPTKKGEGWIGDPRTWELDVGRLSQALYFYQDPGTKPAERYWPSIDLGTEIYISDNQIAEWTVSDFDIIIQRDDN